MASTPVKDRIHILQFGADGQLGLELTRLASEDAGLHHTVLSQDQAEFTRPDDIAAAVMAQPRLDVVINAAAYTAVDRAESEKALAEMVNGTAVGRLAQACQARNVPLVHVSTDYVYDGTKATPYVESDATGPLNVYGQTKLMGEELIRARLPQHVILRTSWVYSAHGGNFVKTMLRLGREREELRIVDDQHGAPTSARDLGEAVLAVARRLAQSGEKAPFGVFHFSGGGETSWRKFAEEIFRQASWAQIRARVVPIAAADYPTPARRPANSRLDLTKIGKAFGIVPQPWQKALSPVLAELRQGFSA
ncbi:MAG TPA: dTDP-4-dehydrorhamnose reductase, partial [Rhizomicrobium sp.]|nr:dTDP-4-dehydrorhamnose reductase [Rhizomicrobium sp.]